MNIVIVGAGEIGRHLATVLSLAGHRISVVEKDAGVASELEDQVDAKVIPGDGSSVTDLADAGIGECELFLALTSSNTANLVSCSIAKSLLVPQVVARVHPGLQREEWLFDFRGHFSIDHIFSSERLTAIELAKHVRNPDAGTIEEIARGRVELQQVTLDPASDACHLSLRKLAPPKHVRIATIQRNGTLTVPDADSVLAPGDELTVFGAPGELRAFAARLRGGTRAFGTLRAVIFGGNEYGFTLAQMLEVLGCKVRVFERDPELCEALVGRLSKSTIINADATVAAVLEQEQVGEADFFISTSRSDEDNVMSCMQAHALGVKHCLTLIHRADYAHAISSYGESIGILAAVSPREATQREIQRFLTSERYHLLRAFGDNDLLEIRVGAKAPVAGRAVQDAGLPPGVVLVGQLRGIHGGMPGPDDTLEPGDHLYAVVSRASRKAFVKRVKG